MIRFVSRLKAIWFRFKKVSWKAYFLGNGVKHGKLTSIVHSLIVVTLGFLFLYPILYMLSLSFMSLDDLLNTRIRWIPSSFYLENFKIALQVLNLPKSLWDTIQIVVLPALFSTVSAGLIGYGFSRFEFPLKKMWLTLVILVYIIPSQLILLPQFVWFKDLGLLGTVWTFLLPASLGQGLFSTIYILIFYSFFNMIPKTLDEAAYIDGAGEGRVFLEIGVKLSLQPFLICLLFSFVWYWNDFYRVSYFMMQTETKTLVQMLNIFEATYTQMEGLGELQARINEPVLLAGTLLTILPLLLVYAFTQKYFVESVDSTGLTGQ
jgi:multiple sugar transport system permease protein